MFDSFVELVHVISGMVYFGLPFTFGRWYGSAAANGGIRQLILVTGKIKTFVNIHLNLSALIILLTGLHLAVARGWWHGARWPHWALLLMVLSILNLHLLLRPALARIAHLEDPEHPTVSATRIRIAVFSATHHTLVTLMVVLMVFRAWL